MSEDNILRLHMGKRYVTPTIADLNPPEVIAACRLMKLIEYMRELPELAPYHDVLLNELVKQGAGKQNVTGRIDLYFSALVKSLKQPKETKQ